MTDGTRIGCDPGAPATGNPDMGQELERLRGEVAETARAVARIERYLQAVPPVPNPRSARRMSAVPRRRGIPLRVLATAAMIYGTAGALVLTGLLSVHGLQPVLALAGSFATGAWQWFLDLVPGL